MSYWYKNTYGPTFGWQNTRISLNPAHGTANGQPNSNMFIPEAGCVPFGKAESWANMKLGAQYIAYTRFDGGVSNQDGNGRSAGANNTFLLFAWLVF